MTRPRGRPAAERPAGTAVTIFVNGTASGTVTADAGGRWSYVFGSAPADGLTITARAEITSPGRVVVDPGGGIMLAALTLTGSTFAEGDAPGTVIGTISGRTAGSTLSITPNDGRLALSSDGTQLLVGLSASSAGSIAVTLTETLASATNSPRATSGLMVTVNAASMIEPTQVYTFDFSSAAYSGPSGSIADPIAAGLLTHSRQTALTAPGLDGKYQTFAAGTPARTSRGLWLRGETRTNGIRNNSMTGAAAGSPGTLPTGWQIGSMPSGLTREIVAVGAADPDRGLPYIDIRYAGTLTSALNHNIAFGGTSDIAAAAGDRFVGSAWLGIVGGSLPIDNGTSIKMVSTAVGASGVTLGTAGTVTTQDRVMARDTKPRRLKLSVPVATSNANAPAALRLAVLIAFKAGTTYDFTLRICAPQMEKVADAQSDASLPILTTNAAVTHEADVLALAGAALTMAQGAAAGLELRTFGLRGSGLDFRKAYPLVVANGNVNVLSRTAQGELASDLGPSVKTYRSYRTQFDWRQDHRVQWGGGRLAVASSSPAHRAEASGSVPAVNTMAVKVDGCLQRLGLDNGFKADLSAYTAQTADLVVYGATSGGITAAASAIRDGRSAIVVGGWREVVPGGMAAGGLGAVDASVSALNEAFGGMSLDYARFANELLGNGSPDNKSVPSSMAVLYFDWLIRTHQVNMRWSKGVTTATKTGTRIASFSTRLGQSFSAKRFVDAGYEGDLMAAAGVSSRVGREAQDANNGYNGNRGSQSYSSPAVGVAEHQFTPATGSGYSTILTIDPYKTPGVASSGLIEGVQSYPVGTLGAADAAIQAYNFRITATRAANRVSFYPDGPPAGYSAARYELLGRYMAALASAGYTAVSISGTTGTNQYNIGLFMLLNGVGSVYDINSNNGFSTDTFGANWGEGWAAIMQGAGIASPSANYAVASYEEREVFWKWQESHVRGLFYYLGESGDARIPAAIRDDARTFGLDPAYYLDPHENDRANWMTQLYVREARALTGRMILEATDVTATDGTAPRSTNSIAMGSYPIDSHHVRRFVDTSTGTPRVVCEGNLFANVGGNRKFPVPMEMIMPQAAECSNLFVTFAASARHTGFGALRMEMVHMALSEAAGIMSSLAVANESDEPDYSLIRPKLLAAGCVADQVN